MPFQARKETMPGSVTSLRIEGARVHNLKGITLDIPWNRLTVITGPSGSGKSSLAYDTIYAEGQRQYIESLSVYSRQFLHQLERPDVDAIKGLQPTIAVDQRRSTHNPRSTVSTVTEIYDYLRLLFARIGLAHCYQCGRPIRQQTPEQIAREILRLEENTRLMILAPVVRGRKGQHKELLNRFIKSGFVRARIDGAFVELNPCPELDPQKYHNIEIVIDRLIQKEGIAPRLLESLKLGIKMGEGLVNCLYEKERNVDSDGTTRSVWKDLLFSTIYSCPKCKINYMELEPRTFSFNSPYGVCTTCRGIGKREGFDATRVIPDLSLSIAGGAIEILDRLPKKISAPIIAAIAGFTEHYQLDTSIAVDRWDRSLRHRFLLGHPVASIEDNPVDEDEKRIDFGGLLQLLDELWLCVCDNPKQKRVTELLEPLRGTASCLACEGTRIRPEARTVTVNKMGIATLTALSVSTAIEWFRNFVPAPEQQLIAGPIVEQITLRLEFLEQIGLGYLTLDRSADSLSGGEHQRVRLATGLGSGLVGVCYVLDEPSSGLHPRDNYRLIDAMRHLQRRGNTVLVVEHDEAIMRHADWLIDMGPGAGRLGGEVLAQNSPEAIIANPTSLTGRYLAGIEAIPIPQKRRKPVKSRMLTFDGVTTNNLKNVSVSIPLGTFVCVTGVSGSGKSSLLNETIVPALLRKLGNESIAQGHFQGMRGASKIDKLILIDQAPIGRSPRSNPATYIGLFDEIRKVFAGSRDAKLRGYKAGRFSFNVPGGRCEQCQGQGVQKVEMHFLPDMFAVCPVCMGKRFNQQTLEIKYKNRSIADVLEMTVDEAILFFENFPPVLRPLESLQKVGLGYLTLGQSSTTLSGGEAQRIKLATELAKIETGNTLYVLDEPTCGLHTHDIRRLLEVLDHLVQLGNTVVVIEHHLDVMKSADRIIDLGPEGGINGGNIVATGTPEQIALLPDNYTGQFLRMEFERWKKR